MSRCRPRRIQPANMCEHSNPPRSSIACEHVLSRGKNEPCIGRGLSTSSNERRKRIKKIQTAPARHAGLATIPSSLLRVGSVRRLGSPCLRDREQTAGETHCCIVEVTSKDALNRNARILCEDGTSWCKTFCPPLRNVMTWPFQSLNSTCESETSMGSESSSTTVSTNWVTSASHIFEPVLRQGASDRDKQALPSLV